MLVDVDGVAATTNSSQSTLNLPAGATIRYARLQWGSAGDGTDNNGDATVQFDTPATPGIAYTAETANYGTQCGSLNPGGASRGFSCSRDVTTLVQAGGNGTYTVGGIEQRANTATTAPDHWSGWGLYVVYELASEPLRRLVLSDGFVRVASGAPNSITATGFVAPAAGTVNARLTYMVGEGDSEIRATTPPSAARCSTPPPPEPPELRDPRPHADERKNPNNTNHYGFDIHSVPINGAIANNATTATFSFTSTQDSYFPFALGVAIELGGAEPPAHQDAHRHQRRRGGAGRHDRVPDRGHQHRQRRRRERRG